MEILNNQKSCITKAIIVLIVIVSIYFAVRTISEIKKYNYIGGGTPATNVISFDGKGEVSAAPDLATISFSIIADAPLAKDAQTKVTAKETAVLAFLDVSGIAKKDIKTENYSSYPKYEYRNAVCPQPQYNVSSSVVGAPVSPVYCPPGKQVLTGYEVSENISVQVHDLTKTGDIVKGIGNIGISNLNGPNFSIEKQDQLKEQARKMAIDEAKAKAETLSKDLGVHLVRIVNFSENGNYPIMYAGASAKSVMADSVATPSPALPTGENKITSNVTITYEIR